MNARSLRSPVPSGALRAAIAACAVVAVATATAFSAGTSAHPPAHRAAAVGAVTVGDPSSATPTSDPTPAPGSDGRRNVVFVLTDDLSWNLVRFMPNVQALMAKGMTFDNYTVTDSLCCPSRTSIFTGEYPHNTHVVSNAAPDGGFVRFEQEGDQNRTFAVSVHDAGVGTAFAGKYLNAYGPETTQPTADGLYNPPGWDQWGAMGGGGYNGYNYKIVLNDSVVTHGQDDSDYTTTVLQKFGADYLSNAIGSGRPFLLELAPFAPHAPYVPARSDLNTFAGLRLEHGANWNRHPSGAPRWLAGLPPLTPAGINYLNHAFEWRVEAVQAVDRMIGSLVAQLAVADQLNNTVFVFSSDNGYHMGEYGLFAGKQTAFDTDVRVPLVVAGPGIPAGRVDHHLVENIDLAPTFEQLTGASIPSTVDGRSLVPLLHGQKVPWRTLAEIEHTHPAPVSTDPDKQTASDGTPPSYVAVRSAAYTYVRYADGEREFYDRVRDPAEMHNTYSTLPRRAIAMLNREANALSTCVGTAQCDAAGRPAVY